MKKWNVLNGIAVVLTGVLLPQITLADYVGPYNQPGFGSSLSQASALTSPLAKGLNASSGAGSSDSLAEIADRQRLESQAVLEKLQKSITSNQEEAKLRRQLQDTKNGIVKDQQTQDLISILGMKQIKDVRDQSQAALARTQSMRGPRPLNAGEIDEGSLGKACRNGVDFGDWKSMTKFMTSSVFQNWKQNYSAFVEKNADGAEEQLVAKVKELKKTFGKRAEQRKANEFQANLQTSPDAVAKGLNGEWSEDKRVSKLKKDVALAEAEKEEADKGLNDVVFDKLLPGLIAGKKNKGKFLEVKSVTTNALRNSLAQVHDSVSASARRLEENCKREAQQVGTDSLAPGTLTTQIYAMLASSPFLVSAANNMLQSFNYYRNNLQCTNATNGLESIYGQSSALAAQIETCDTINEPKPFLDCLDTVVSSMDDANNRVSSVLKPAMDSCKHVEAEFEALQKKRDEAQQVVSQLSGAGAAPAAGGAPQAPVQRSNAGQTARANKGGQFGFGRRDGHI